MKLFNKFIITSIIGHLIPLIVTAQGQYTNYKTGIQKIESMTREYPAICSAKSLAKTAGGKDVMVIIIGNGEKDNKPGIAVIGNPEGSYILGRELALGFARSLLNESSAPEIKSLLDKVTFYVFPDVNPDATDQYFQAIRYERNVNTRPVDEDRDFVTDEDPFEDLNKDGLITLIRVSDSSGTFTESSEDKRIMVMADIAKGEHGSYSVYSEGIDNDKDGKFNEDGPGGVNFNRNLTYNYEEFGSNAGLHPVSEPETKAVMDFLFDHFNIYVTFAFGPQDNMNSVAGSGGRGSSGQSQPSTPGQDQPQGSGQMFRMGERKITTVQKSDESVIKFVSEKYREITGVKGAPPVKTAPGNFADWSYYHYGRYSFSTPAWWFPVERDKNAEAAFLKYAEDNKLENVFVPWTEIEHPDFPGKKTEVGGIRPFVMTNPPEDKIEELILSNYTFIKEIAAMHPDLEFTDIETENKGDKIFRISLKIHNQGLFATCTEAGQGNVFTRLMRLSVETVKGQSILSGQKVQRLPRLLGNGNAEYSWLIMGKGTVKISAGAVNTGFVKTVIELK
jgi:hypothetical protein